MHHMDYLNLYLENAHRTFSPKRSEASHILHVGSSGVAKEAGELLDMSYRVWEYGKPFDEKVRENILEECGDILWYMAITLNIAGWTFQEAFDYNITKLEKRYPEGFSNEAALARADKKEGE